MKKLVIMVCFALGFSSVVLAQGDAEAGKAKSATCAACHGMDGNSTIDSQPKLAGQHAGYLAKQLKEFKLAAQSGGAEGRNNPVMNGMAMGLSEQDILDLSAYYAGQEAKQGATPEDVIEKGQALYRGGDLERGITACIACHGPRGNGMNAAGFPDISGQHAAYLKTQLDMFKSAGRMNDLNGMMQDIAKKMSDEDIDVLSKYLGGLH